MRPLPPTPCAARPAKGTGQTEPQARRKAHRSTRGLHQQLSTARQETPSLDPIVVAAEDSRQEGTNHISLPRAIGNGAKKQPIRTSRPTSGSRKPPASMRLQETSVAGQRRGTYGSQALQKQ